MKEGYGIISDLESGTSHMMLQRGIHSMQELIGLAQPNPITDFMALTPVKKISEANKEYCVSCGNCARCPYLAITLDEQGYPPTDAALCIGCSICAKKCFVGAISMRSRTPEELAILKEN
jgi:dihydropyrimidine dehydrogenase (NAD+) subunit PreA